MHPLPGGGVHSTAREGLSRRGSGGGWLQRLGIFAWWNGCGRTAVSNSVMATTRVVCAIHRPAGDVDLTPDASFRAVVLTYVLFAFSFDLDVNAINQDMRWALRAAIRDVDRKRPVTPVDGAEMRHAPVQPRQLLPTKPVVWRSAIPNSTFMVRHVWRATSLKIRDLLLLPEGRAFQFISESNEHLTNASMCCQSADCQRPTALHRLILGSPVRRLGGRRCRFTPADDLAHWIQNINPSPNLQNRAGPICKT